MKRREKKKARPKFFALLIVLTVLLCAVVLVSCSPESKKTALKVIIIPKFEVDEMAGDFPGEYGRLFWYA